MRPTVHSLSPMSSAAGLVSEVGLVLIDHREVSIHAASLSVPPNFGTAYSLTPAHLPRSLPVTEFVSELL